jgi:Tfp pilus assembly protein PilE
VLALGILIAIVLSTYAGIQARSRNNQRTATIRTLQEHIESFYSQNMFYPSLNDLNNSSWVAANMKGLSVSSYQDPSWTNAVKACTVNGHPVLIAKSQNGCYGYWPTNNGASCENNDTTCNDYTLSATLEQGGGTYTKVQLD